MLTAEDEEHLRLLTIFHYVLAGISCIPGLLGVLYIALGGFTLMVTSMSQQAKEAGIVGFVFLFIGIVLVIIVFGSAVLQYFVGRFISERRHYTFVFIFSIVQLLFFPLGTALGVFTLIVLSRPQVKATMISQGLIAS